ncbi:hypothetical protein [Streptomyces sp. NPDC050507]|uniref:hypothetical protein n=1 Tax=Streptomyces sp. NPDC050507 TaxID=3365619 RepID=UPI0037A8D249
MNASATVRSPATRWTVVVPLVAALAPVFGWGRELPPFAVALVSLCLCGAVLAAVHHAEVVAHRDRGGAHRHSARPRPASA